MRTLTTRPSKRQNRIRFWPSLVRCGTAAFLLGAVTSPGAEDEAAPSPEEMFEGGPNAYNNWAELSLGGLFTSGNRAQAEEQHRLADGVFGGIEDLHYQRDLGSDLSLSLDGRALFDLNDYRVTLELKRAETGYLRFHFEEFRTWSNGDGGYYRPGDVWYPLSDEALTLDRGELSFEAGLTIENAPSITFKYTRLYREGQKGSTAWGFAHSLLNAPMSDPTLVRGVSPSFYDVDETRDTFELDVAHQIKATDLGGGLRYEIGDLNNARKMTQWPGEPVQRRITHREGASYDMFNLHAFTETRIQEHLVFSSGFLFANQDTDLSGSRIYGSDFDAGHVPNALNGLGYINLVGNSQRQEYVLNLNLMATPTTHLAIVPSIRVRFEDWDANSSAYQNFGAGPSTLLGIDSDGDLLDVRERLDARYTGFTNWVLYARGEWTQGEGNLNESGGLGLTSPILRETEDRRFFQKYSAGVRWYPARRASIDVGGYYKLNQYDYDHLLDNTPNGGGNRYPAYLRMQDFATCDGNVRLTLRPHRSVSLVSRYEFQKSTIRTTPDPVSGLGESESSSMTSHILAQDVSWSPWSRLSLQAGFNYVLSETETPTSDYTQAILDAQNNYWTVNFNSGLVLDDRTDLNLGCFYYRTDNYEDNSVAGLPLGAEAEEYGITGAIVRRFTDRLRLTLRYGFFHYEDFTSGNNRDYEAHVLLSSLQFRF